MLREVRIMSVTGKSGTQEIGWKAQGRQGEGWRSWSPAW